MSDADQYPERKRRADQYPERERRAKPISPTGLKGYRDRIYQGAGGQWRLTVQEKKRILLNNIYGVDIDPQAVETTKLSLLLKVLDGESAETIGSTLRLFHERALPDLSDNIKCGNSLIGPDFYEGQQLSMFDEEERYRINVFDWQAEFPDVFVASGPRTGRPNQSPERKRRAEQYPERKRRADQYPERERRADQYPERQQRADQYPERQRRAKRAAAPDGIEPVADARGSVLGPVAYARGSDARPVADARGSDRGLDLHKQLSATTTAVDRLVYKLYGLTDEEIAIVEEAAK